MQSRLAKCKKSAFKVFMTVAVLTGTFLSANVCSHADTFVDLAFKVDSKDYTSKSVNKSMDLAPFIEKGTTMVPFRTILEELGYVVEWQKSTSTILASNETNTIKLKINNKYAEVNGEKKELSVAPKIISSRTVVPLRFLSENSGATVAWDGSQKAIYISRVGKYDTGTVLFYEEKDSQNAVYVYDGNEIITIPLEKRKIVNWYSYKGQILATIFDDSKNNNSFYIFRDNTFVPLIENFDIRDAFEYNDNLIIHGFDRNQKCNKLCRFDGQTFTVIQDNFEVGKYFVFKDRLVINRYDNSNRNYTLLAFDKSSWSPAVLESGIIMSEYVVDNNISYMIGQRQEGSKKFLATFDGNSIGKSSFNIVHDDLNVNNINDVVLFNGRFFVNLGGQLTVVENKKLNKFLFQDTGANIRYDTKLIKVFNNKLYVCVNEGFGCFDAYFKPMERPATIDDKKGRAVFEIASNYSASSSIEVEKESYILLNSNSYKRIITRFQPETCMIENDKLLILGRDADSLDQVLYATNGSLLNKVIDIVGINKSTSVGVNSFLDVKDINRITKSERNTMLFYNGSSVSNLVVGMQTNKMTTLGNNLIFSGYESDIQRNKVYSYGTSFNEQLSNFDVNYWEIINKNTLFVNGTDKDTEVNKLYKFTDANKTFVKDYIYVNSIIKAKGNYYLVDAIDRDPNSYTKDKKVLYIYDEMNGKFIEMKVNLLITKMIFRN